MGKKVKEYKAGDFIFAKVKGYPAWPARVQKPNGKKYFVYFYGTGETANLPPNMIFDYAENKDKFLTKTVKRRDFNDGVKQIEHDFANNVPLELVIGVNTEAPMEASNDTANDTTANDTMDDSAIDTTAADDTVADTTANNTSQNDTAVEDSDDQGALVIDEGKTEGKPPKSRKLKVEPKTPAKEAAKTPKTPRGKPKKEDKKEEEEPEEKTEEIVSRSGRKIRPKRYMDEQTEDNSTLPSPAPKKRRGASPAPEKDKERQEPKEKSTEKNIKHFNNVSQSALEELKEPFKPADAEKENILIAYIPSGQYVGIKLFQTRPNSFKDDETRLQWDKRAATNAITLKHQLEKGHITAGSIMAQLVMDLNLTDEEKASLDKERETEEKRSRVNFLKTEMKLIELDAKIKTCLCLEKADTELCLKLLDELTELEIKPLMLLKHPTCMETLKRLRAYVGNTPSWDLSEGDALQFSKQAHRIRKQADVLYKSMKELFTSPTCLSFWEFFSERVLLFKKLTANLSADELLEMVHEPLEMTLPSSHLMMTSVERANEIEPPVEDEEPEVEAEPAQKKKNNGKSKKANTPAKPPLKRQNSRKQLEEKETEKESEKNDNEVEKKDKESEKNNKGTEKKDKASEKKEKESERNKETEKKDKASEKKEKESEKNNKETEKKDKSNEKDKESVKKDKESEKKDKASEKKEKASEKKHKESEKNENEMKDKESEENDTEQTEDTDMNEKPVKDTETEKEAAEDTNTDKQTENETEDTEQEKVDKESEKEESETVKESNEKPKESGKSKDKSKDEKKDGDKVKESEKETERKDKEDEPRAKRSRGENKKTDPPPRSPAKRKSKA